MHYISATRKKSCNACVKSKRRCDLTFPLCRRCLVKGLDCTYPTPSSRRDRKGTSSPDWLPLRSSGIDGAAEILSSNGASTDLLGHAALPSYTSSSSVSSPDSWQEWPPQEPQVCCSLRPEVDAQAYLNDGQVQYVLRALRACVSSMAYTGSALFLHQKLWQRYQPESYQDCVALSALYLCKTSGNASLIVNSINGKVAKLRAASSNWGILEHLAAVQTLIIYQIIRLFDPSLNGQVQAQKQNILLEVWTARLWKRSFTEPTLFANCYETWVFDESLRRTIMMSVFVRCAWSLYTRDGLADQVPVLSQIPFTRNLRAWKTDLDDWNSSVLPGLLSENGLMMYKDFSHKWTYEDEVETLDPFAKLLLAACRGADDPRLLS
ncbi:hypothetical protein N0V95_001520 [Ascochyta clinopodiicola]|nr:hypothetical protein N0V95_001520 [Ascochyta clinopodiicola]